MRVTTENRRNGDEGERALGAVVADRVAAREAAIELTGPVVRQAAGRAPGRTSWRRAAGLIGLLSLTATACGTGATAATRPAHAEPLVAASPADAFMRSVVSRDGALGWQQLCSDLQHQIARDELRRQAGAQHASEAARGLTLSFDPMAVRSLPQGGEAHVYQVTAHLQDGHQEQRTYVVRTGPGGCVEEIGAA
jgi:hypothetical protein